MQRPTHLNRRKRRAHQNASREFRATSIDPVPMTSGSSAPAPNAQTHISEALSVRVSRGFRTNQRRARLTLVICILMALVFTAYRSYLEPKAWKLIAKVPGSSTLFWSAAIAHVTSSTEGELSQSLAHATAIFDTARNRKVALNMTLVIEAGSRAIETAERRSDIRSVAWQSVAAAIAYGSALQTHFNIPLDLRDCSDRPPQWVLAKGINDTETTLLLRPVYSSCGLNLDLESTTAGLAWPDGSHHKPVVYENGFECRSCVVVYTGGPLSVVTPKMAFQNSVFVFLLTSEPPPHGYRFVKTLLESKFVEAEE